MLTDYISDGNYRKYEEIYPPEVNEFVYITDDTYTKQQVLSDM
jgi:Cyclin, N-terminal domain